MTADTLGGIFTHVLDLARGLRPAGVEISLVTFGRRLSVDQRAAAAAAGIGHLHETTLALEWMENPWREVAAAQELLIDVERDQRPDIVHLNGFAHGRGAWRAPVLVAGHSCVFSWWAAVHGHRPPAQWERYRAAVRDGLAGAAAVVAPSAEMLAALDTWYGPLPPLTQAVHNGSSYAGSPQPVPKQPLVLSAGRLWDEAKNIDALVSAAARPALRGRVLLAGEGDAGGDPHAIRALGQLSAADLARVRRSAAVYAAPARYEPFGLAILEAARDRCALVLGDIPSLREIWGEAATYVAAEDEERLGWTLEELLAHPARAARRGEDARRRAARFTVAAMAGHYRRLYGRLVNASRSVAA